MKNSALAAGLLTLLVLPRIPVASITVTANRAVADFPHPGEVFRRRGDHAARADHGDERGV
jgi:hypothetical protein